MYKRSDININTATSALQIGEYSLDLSSPIVMGILNITPDSFFDGGKNHNDTAVLNRVEKMVNEGATIIDIGAVSTRPGATEVTEKTESDRILPVVKLVVKNFPGIFISIDTFRSSVAKKTIETGAHIINDISGGRYDDKMFETIAKLKVPYMLMHVNGTLQNMHNNPAYEDVVSEINDFFSLQLNKLSSLGVTSNIVLDPGFGFGKNLEHNYRLLTGLKSFTCHGHPILAGVSRKSMINKVLDSKPMEALNGTTVVNTMALLNGAAILRVHDVKEAVEVVKLYEVYRLYNEISQE